MVIESFVDRESGEEACDRDPERGVSDMPSDTDQRVQKVSIDT